MTVIFQEEVAEGAIVLRCMTRHLMEDTGMTKSDFSKSRHSANQASVRESIFRIHGIPYVLGVSYHHNAL